MFLLLAALVALFIALIVVSAVGALLPAVVRNAAEISVPGDRDRVIAALTSIETLPSWQPDTRAVARQDAGVWFEHCQSGTHRVTRKMLGDGAFCDGMERAGEHVQERITEVVQDGANTRITVCCTRRVASVFGRFAGRYITGPSEAEIRWLQALARHLGDYAQARRVAPQDAAVRGQQLPSGTEPLGDQR